MRRQDKEFRKAVYASADKAMRRIYEEDMISRRMKAEAWDKLVSIAGRRLVDERLRG